MKSTIKAVLVLALFCGTAFADGDMGNGGFWAGTEVATPAPNADGDMGNGGKTCPAGQTCLAEQSNEFTSFFDYVSYFLGAD